MKKQNERPEEWELTEWQKAAIEKAKKKNRSIAGYVFIMLFVILFTLGNHKAGKQLQVSYHYMMQAKSE